MELTITDMETLLKIGGSVFTITSVVGGAVMTMVRRHYDRVEHEFRLLEEDLRRDITYLERQTGDLKEQRDLCREDLYRARNGFQA